MKDFTQAPILHPRYIEICICLLYCFSFLIHLLSCYCHRLNICVSPNSYVETSPQYDFIRRWVFGRQLGNENKAFMNQLLPLSETAEESFPPSSYEDIDNRCLAFKQELGCHQIGQTSNLPTTWSNFASPDFDSGHGHTWFLSIGLPCPLASSWATPMVSQNRKSEGWKRDWENYPQAPSNKVNTSWLSSSTEHSYPQSHFFLCNP